MTAGKSFALAATVLACAAPALAGGQADPAAILRASVDAPSHVSFVGQVETVRFASKRASATLVRIEHKAPHLTRRSFLAPESLYGDYIVVKDEESYLFDTRHGRMTVEREDVPDDTSVEADDLGRILSNYRPMTGGTAIVAGRPCDVVILVNKHTGERTERLWIDSETRLILRREEYRGTGAVAVTARFEEIRYTNAVPAELFPTRPPAGFSTGPGMQFAALSSDLKGQAKEAGFTPVTPKNLPQGFSLVGSQAATVNGVKTLHLTYSDGLRTLSLFENARGAAVDFGSMHPQTVSFEGQEAQYVEDGSTVLLAWHEQGLYYALVGDLSKNELIDIAKSVVP